MRIIELFHPQLKRKKCDLNVEIFFSNVKSKIKKNIVFSGKTCAI